MSGGGGGDAAEQEERTLPWVCDGDGQTVQSRTLSLSKKPFSGARAPGSRRSTSKPAAAKSVCCTAKKASLGVSALTGRCSSERTSRQFARSISPGSSSSHSMVRQMANREVLQRASPHHWVRRNLWLSQRRANETAACSLRLIFLIPLIALSTSINEQQQQQQLNNCRGITAPLLLCQLFIVALVLL